MKTQDIIQNSLPANRNWEITFWIFGIGVFALLFSNTNAFALNPQFDEEAYIDDIPFSTEAVAANYYYKDVISEKIDFEEEDYIDDITVNTELVSDRYAYSKAAEVKFEMEDEDYIDDIPFDTCSLVKAVRMEVDESQYVAVK